MASVTAYTELHTPLEAIFESEKKLDDLERRVRADECLGSMTRDYVLRRIAFYRSHMHATLRPRPARLPMEDA